MKKVIILENMAGIGLYFAKSDTPIEVSDEVYEKIKGINVRLLETKKVEKRPSKKRVEKR